MATKENEPTREKGYPRKLMFSTIMFDPEKFREEMLALGAKPFGAVRLDVKKGEPLTLLLYLEDIKNKPSGSVIFTSLQESQKDEVRIYKEADKIIILKKVAGRSKGISFIDRALEILKDGEWHSLDTFIDGLGLPKNQVEKVLGFLGDYGFIIFEKEEQRAKNSNAIREIVDSNVMRKIEEMHH